MASAVQELVRDTERPMRWPRAQALARKYSTQVLDVWEGFERKLLAWLPGEISLADASKSAPDMAAQGHGLLCGCGGCSPAKELPPFRNLNQPLDIIHRSYKPVDLRRLRTALGEHFTMMELNEFEALFDQVLAEMMQGGGQVLDQGGVWNSLYADSYVEGGRKAYEDAKAALGTADRTTAEWFRQYVPNVVPLNASSRFVQITYKEGFQLITAKITRWFKGEAMQVITEGIAAGQDWQSIARALHRHVGLGAGWHWRRLVRTEMVGTFDRASRERYQAMRVKYVRYSMVPGACPICEALREQNGGYYRLGTAPALPSSTHPNCRCRYLPKFSLPRGVSIPT